ncbi:MAG: discoidin domain-containing protein [Verrucomicrobia bacterium]|nr:discoidin domain-containing protein [Verrucomicrobiota bacterium]
MNTLRTAALAVLGASVLLAADPGPQPVPLRSANPSSTYGDFTAAKAIDGVISDTSRWTSAQSRAPAWLEIQLAETTALLGLHVHTGLNPATAVRGFTVQFWRDGQWIDIPSATVADNQATALALAFDDTVAVRTDRLRLWITATPDGYARIKEVVVWPAALRSLPPLATPTEAHGTAAFVEKIPLIYLNQSGFNLGAPKRFTAPTLPDRTPFAVRPAGGGATLFSGQVTGHIGDFSAFDPADDRREFVVVAGPHTSVPFRIGHWWLERVTYQNAVNFMIDSRHYVGNHRPVCRGSFGWRDDHHFGWELHTLVPQFLSNPSAYTRMPRQITYEAPSDPKLWGRLELYRADIPDLVKLIHWGADVLVTQQVRHEHLKAQLAYFLYAWPWLKAYLPAQNYTVVRDHTFAIWSDATKDRDYPYDESPEHDLLALKTKVGTTKGAYPPGFSVEPNLLLYEVARREGRPDAEKYFAAAHRQAEWMIAQLDWNDPLTTKGQRMSEWITVTGLAHFLRAYPDRAPAGLAAKLAAWAEVAVRRSANLWDFRKLDDGAGWTPMGDKPTMWNEPGNVVGLPAALLAVRPFVTAAATRQRLTELVHSHFDAMFGRNPTGRHFSYDAPREIEGVEHGWYSFYKGGIGQLEKARFVIDGGPKNQHFPYHPEVGNVGWSEGWVTFNTAFNLSLAYLAYAETSLTLRRDGDEIIIRLTAPLNFDATQVESAAVTLHRPSGETEVVTVTEDSPDARTFSARVKLPRAAAAQVTYGFGYLAHRASLPPAATSP